MAEKRILGVGSIGIGDIASDGGAATTFNPLGVTYKDTAELNQESGEDITHECEELDDPIEVIPTKGKTTIKWAIVDFTPETLVKVLGGAVVGTAPKTWEAPDNASTIEKSVQITDKRGSKITFPRVSLKANINYKLAKNGIAQVQITGTVLQPTKAGVKSCIIG